MSMTLLYACCKHYEILVIPFGLTNAPTSSYGFDELGFKPFLGQFVILFIDENVVYSNSNEIHDPNYPTHDLNVLAMIFALKA
jgi:hypothetical protein